MPISTPLGRPTSWRTRAVLAMTLSLDEAAQVIGRGEPTITWGVGCHPRKQKAQDGFDVDRFVELAERTAVVGEVGLDTGSRVPLEQQLRTFRRVLAVVAELPRPTAKTVTTNGHR